MAAKKGTTRTAAKRAPKATLTAVEHRALEVIDDGAGPVTERRVERGTKGYVEGTLDRLVEKGYATVETTRVFRLTPKAERMYIQAEKALHKHS